MKEHYGFTDEAYYLEPGETFSSPFSLKPYGSALADGHYRLVMTMYPAEEPSWGDVGCAVAEFSVEHGNWVIS